VVARGEHPFRCKLILTDALGAEIDLASLKITNWDPFVHKGTQEYTPWTTKVGMREFRDNLATYLIESEAPIAITRHGDPVGLYIPTRRKPTDADWQAYLDTHARLQKTLRAKGLTEDDLIADFEEVRKNRSLIAFHTPTVCVSEVRRNIPAVAAKRSIDAANYSSPWTKSPASSKQSKNRSISQNESTPAPASPATSRTGPSPPPPPPRLPHLDRRPRLLRLRHPRHRRRSTSSIRRSSRLWHAECTIISIETCMNRREFIVAFGAAAATPKARVSGNPDRTKSLPLQSGDSRLVLVPTPDGYGLALFTRVQGRIDRIAYADFPVRMFYGTRTGPNVVNIAFQQATRTKHALTATSTFTDKHSNRWQLTFHAAPAANSAFHCTFDYLLVHGNAENVFFEHPLTPDMPPSGEDTYVLMPGLLYDGNRLTEAPMAIPQLAAAQNFQVDTPIFTLSIPLTAFHQQSTGKTLMYLAGPATTLGMSGFSCVSREGDSHVSLMTPCYREKHFHHNHYTPETPQGATIKEGTRFSIPVSYLATSCPDIPGLFETLQPIRNTVRASFQRTNRMPLSTAATLVADNFNTRMWAHGPRDQFYINAMLPDYDLARSGMSGLYPGWQLQVGWCSGVITGYAFLKLGDDLSCKRSRLMLDKIATAGLTPSGLFSSVYANEKWDPAINNSAGWQHMRVPADATFYLLKSLALERARGFEHPNWEKAAVSNLDAFTRLWTEHHDFGHKVDRNTLAITEPGTAAAALCIGALALGASLPRGKQYLAVAIDAAKSFYEQYVHTGWITAGPIDIPNAPDSESVTALLESYVTMYEVTHDRQYLGYARDTARHLSTWIVAYNATFPEGTFCQRHRLESIGGVLANSQNHHIGPSFCTNSGSALLRLYQYTGDNLSLQLLEDTISGLPQYVSTGEEPFHQMAPGMVSEQFNMTDELGARGEMGWVCASWPATSVLLSHGEVPSVFVDLDTGRTAVFDQIDATFDAKTRHLHLSNPTSHPATLRVQKSHGPDLTLTLASGEKKVVPLATAPPNNS
jgi:antitoxin (DNA-binding transcriptional repressor) of toxin-antitoxin stability system